MAQADRFHLDFDIYAATSQYLKDQRDQARQNQDPTSAQVGSPEEQSNMIEDKTSRAKQRESMEQAGMKAPSPDGQLQQLDEIMEERSAAQPDADSEQGDS